jgi:hypothetical protein
MRNLHPTTRAFSNAPKPRWFEERVVFQFKPQAEPSSSGENIRKVDFDEPDYDLTKPAEIPINTDNEKVNFKEWLNGKPESELTETYRQLETQNRVEEQKLTTMSEKYNEVNERIAKEEKAQPETPVDAMIAATDSPEPNQNYSLPASVVESDNTEATLATNPEAQKQIETQESQPNDSLGSVSNKSVPDAETGESIPEQITSAQLDGGSTASASPIKQTESFTVQDKMQPGGGTPAVQTENIEDESGGTAVLPLMPDGGGRDANPETPAVNNDFNSNYQPETETQTPPPQSTNEKTTASENPQPGILQTAAKAPPPPTAPARPTENSGSSESAAFDTIVQQNAQAKNAVNKNPVGQQHEKTRESTIKIAQNEYIDEGFGGLKRATAYSEGSRHLENVPSTEIIHKEEHETSDSEGV